MDSPLSDKEFLTKMVNFRMPFGKYKDCLLIDLPEHYIVWYNQKGLPKGELGKMLGLMYEIKLNGLEYLLKKIRQNY